MKDLTLEISPAFDLPALDLTRFSDAPMTATVGEKYLVFVLGEEFYAVASRAIAEAAAALRVTKLPNAPEWLDGIANLRGDVISVINLPAALKTKNSTAAPSLKSKFVVLRSEIFEGGAAFAADRIGELVTLSAQAISKTAHAEKSAHVFGTADYKTQTLNLIDAEKLLASLKIGQ